MNYIKRIKLAQQKHPELFHAGLIDCCVEHDDWCEIHKGGTCNCVPVITITTRSGKFRINRKGNCRRLGPEGEVTPTTIDPRRGDLN